MLNGSMEALRALNARYEPMDKLTNVRTRGNAVA